MTTQSSQAQTQSASTAQQPHKTVWGKVANTSSSTTSTTSSSHTHVNGTMDDTHERDSVSSKDITHGETSSQGHSTPASSMADEAQLTSSTPPAPAFRPAPLPAVNPWKARQEEMERKRWKESQDVPP